MMFHVCFQYHRDLVKFWVYDISSLFSLPNNLKTVLDFLCRLLLFLANFLHVDTQAYYQQKIGQDFSSTRDLIF